MEYCGRARNTQQYDNWTLARESSLFDEDTRLKLGEVTNDLEKAQDIFREIKYNIEPMSATLPQYVETKTLGVKGIFTKHQIDRESVPKGLYAYDVQYYRDESVELVLLCQKIMGHRFGAMITAKSLPIGKKRDIQN